LRGLEVYPNTRLQIFDRYGKIFVDRMIESSFSWDGKYNNQPLPSGSYWYILILESGEKLSGSVNIRNY
ncbi:T9SS type B sorting domain-containing protein, partial [Moheibacter sediminis]